MAKKCCATCEFCMPVKGELICAGYGELSDGRITYGMKIEETEKLFPNGCSDYGVSYQAFIDEND